MRNEFISQDPDSEEEVDVVEELEIWRLSQPLISEEKKQIPPGATDRIWKKIQRVISPGQNQDEQTNSSEQ